MRRSAKDRTRYEELWVLGHNRGFRARLPVDELLAHLDIRCRYLPERTSSPWFTILLAGFIGILLGSIIGAIFIQPVAFGVTAGGILGGGLGGGLAGGAVKKASRGNAYWLVWSVMEEGKRRVVPVLHRANYIEDWSQWVKDHANGKAAPEGDAPAPANVYSAGVLYNIFEMNDEREDLRGGWTNWQKAAVTSLVVLALSSMGIFVFFAIAMGRGAGG